MATRAVQVRPIIALLGLAAVAAMHAGCASRRPSDRAWVGNQGGSWDVVFPTSSLGEPPAEIQSRRDLALGMGAAGEPEGFWPDRTPRFDRPYRLVTPRHPEMHLQFRREGRHNWQY